MSKNNLKFNFNGVLYEWTKQYITGKELREISKTNSTTSIYLSLKDPWDDLLISDTESIDLARHGIEYFFTKNPLHFSINNVRFDWDRATISGLKIRSLGEIPETHEIFLDVPDPYIDEPIYDTTIVNLAINGTEHFVSREKCIEFNIIVNGRSIPWNQRRIGYKEVVELAFGAYQENDQTAYSVTYTKGPHSNPQGTMVKNDIVNIKNKMIFNVTATNRS